MIAKNIYFVIKIFIAAFVSILLLSFVFFFYYMIPVHHENKSGETDFVWESNSIWIRMTEGISWGKYDSLGFNNIKVINNPDILVLGSSHMEATQVMQQENTSYLITEYFKGKYSVYNKGISGHDFFKICQYLTKNFELYEKKPKVVVLETTLLNIRQKNVDNILSENMEYTKSFNSGIIGTMQKIPFLRLLNMQFDLGLKNIFLPKKFQDAISLSKSPIDWQPYDQLFSYLQTLEKKYKTQIIIVYHPTGKLKKDGAIEFPSPDGLLLFKKYAKEKGITFVDLTDDFEKMYYEEHHVAHGFVTGKLEYGHLNRYGHEALAKALYKTITNMEKDGEICK